MTRRTPQQVGRLSSAKGKAFERLIVNTIKSALGPGSVVRRSSQADHAYNSDVVVESSGTWLDNAWLELTTGSVSWAKVEAKIEQAKRDLALRRPSAVPCVVWRVRGHRNIWMTKTNSAGILATTNLDDELALLAQ